MRSREKPNYLNTLLDLMLAALCGVAFLLVIFASLRRNAEASRVLYSRKLLTVELVEPPSGLAVGREVGLVVRDDDTGQAAYLDEPQEPPASAAAPLASEPIRLNPTVDDLPSPRYLLQIVAPPARPLKLQLWLRGLDAARLTGDPAAAAAYASVLSDGVAFKLYWKEPDDPIATGRLDPASGFISEELTVELDR